ncbi:DUF3307 domain-containing protein [Clostridium aciditolerans]|uniref:DUF3307 domain-containing protein n=1 Tax=Clostridium aciditolerans TaxID=339861 RepID=A0A934HSQ0_9CLOT|nr:DUF3307 domain-containing protein [Clostridium aciditolerans]MBI6872598.1 DUF3307 domain-containing protein [Clostridium aciditolerans]
MKIYILLVFSHIVGDIFLQRNAILSRLLKGGDLSKLKRQALKYLALHAALYSLPIGLTLIFFQSFNIYRFLIIFLSHFAIDYVKCYMIRYKEMSLEFVIVNLIDQLMHIGVLFVVVNL